MRKKIIIVGGVAGGASAAARLRRMDENAEIIMFEKGEYISFANCGLPYYIGGIIEERDALLVQTVEGMSKKFDMDIRILSEVTKIDAFKKIITVKNLKTKEVYEESYDKLILSPGASPIKPPIPGIDEATNLFTLRNIPDTDAIKSFVDNNKPQSAIVIGGGFIGIEMAENLHHRGIHVTIVEAADQVMGPIDYEMASILHNHIKTQGVDLVLGDGVKSFENHGRKLVLQSGKEIDTDLIIFSIGVRPESIIAKEAGLKLNERGAIQVNEYLQTSDENIYAIGDAIEVVDFVTGNPTMIPLAGPANKQGRIVANNISGNLEKYVGTMGTSIAKVFDMTVASTGNNEKILKAKEIRYEAIHIHPGSHAGYYPGAAPISLKMLFDPITGKILGAQAVGYDGVEKRIDVIATAIAANMTAMDLSELELSYAPPFSSAKDPVNMLGFVAKNITEGLVDTFQWHEVHDIVESGNLLIDVREPIEHELGHIEGAKLMSLGDIRNHLNELPKDKTIYLYCQVGIRGYNASRILMQNGFKVKNLDGGYKTYESVFSSDPSNNCIAHINDSGVATVDCSTGEKKKLSNGNIEKPVVSINACGLQCPGPIMQVYNAIQGLNNDETLEIKATDPGFMSDIQTWCQKTGNTLLDIHYENKVVTAVIKKGHNTNQITAANNNNIVMDDKENATIVIFSQDMDKAMASFIIASGAAAMGKKVTLFFTFWGLNILRSANSPRIKKDFLEKMFGWMMPKGAKKLPISNMNMMGMGPKMINYVMKRKNVDSLPILIKNAMAAGVHIVACAMSMDIMGIKAEELIDGVEIGGVATYLGEAIDSNLNLFI